jgi:hypothetical protein
MAYEDSRGGHRGVILEFYVGRAFSKAPFVSTL